MIEPDLIPAIETRFPGAILNQDTGGDDPSLTLSPDHLVEVCEFLRDESNAQYDLLAMVTSADDQICYQLVSTSQHCRLQLHAPLLAEHAEIDSLAFVWPAANWAEREAHDLRNVAFRGHPNSQPLLVRPTLAASIPTASRGSALLASGVRYPTSIEGLFIHLALDGERVIKVQPELGYRYSGLGKQLARWPYDRGALLAARMDGFSAMQGDLAYALAVETLLQVTPPRRAQQLRGIYAELQRIASHLFWLARCAQDLSDPALAAPAYAWEGRTRILDLFQELGGNPITPDVIAIGGLEHDAPETFLNRLDVLLEDLETLLSDLHRLLSQNPIFRSRLDGIGVIDPGTALGMGMTGPCLRASGIEYDVRDAFPYDVYGTLEVHITTEQGGDAGARYRVRMAEMSASLDMIRQMVHALFAGPINTFADDDTLPPLPSGSVYASVESARGELGVYLASDGSRYLHHAHVRGPSFANLSALPFMTRDIPIDQFTAVLDSLDISMGEVER
jgi:NADH:ubiquinone oxidoreductase subunit D/Ni,Fe-hydrogenase III component G